MNFYLNWSNNVIIKENIQLMALTRILCHKVNAKYFLFINTFGTEPEISRSHTSHNNSVGSVRSDIPKVLSNTTNF